MRLLLMGLILVAQMAIGQSNFYIIENNVQWKNDYSKSFAEVSASVKTFQGLSIVEETDERMIVEITDVVYNPKKYVVSGRALIKKTDAGYSVQIKDLSYKPSSSKANLGNAVVGGNQSYQYFCNDWIKRDKLNKDYYPAMENMNNTFNKLFTPGVENW